ncbi:hypothetical protein M427DRAFT_95806 [Gonapodya prolifera JEL478]|uniref:Defect at low temperature protein 1 n=1 Tax=Gonapodya prolifera (strain JEL478) TaxID=1344416 RepID=A0A139AQ93_GONPJ|nr:hypothetical protein M427DRAFT_95806 [Gonapodya prolifera JEL478]|eukprot:KXS18927.1 hypothetical protein M427DRAFT_95806 [Gonapodya prolifera JEL478]
MSLGGRVLARLRDITVLSLFLALTGCCLILCSWDVFWRAFTKDKRSLFTFGGSVALLGVCAFFIILSRVISGKTALADIPKVFVPINQSDLPKPVYWLVNTELSRVSSVAMEAKPLPETVAITGWGRTSATSEPIYFQSAVLETVDIINQKASQLSPSLTRRPGMTVKRYIDTLVGQSLVDATVARFYLELYEKAQYGREETTESEYADFLKVFALLLKNLGGPV